MTLEFRELVAKELDSLRARLAQAEAENAELRKLVPAVGDEIDCYIDGDWRPCKVVVGPQRQGVCRVTKVEDPEQRQYCCDLTFHATWRWSASKWGDLVWELGELEEAFHKSRLTVTELLELCGRAEKRIASVSAALEAAARRAGK